MFSMIYHQTAFVIHEPSIKPNKLKSGHIVMGDFMGLLPWVNHGEIFFFKWSNNRHTMQEKKIPHQCCLMRTIERTPEALYATI